MIPAQNTDPSDEMSLRYAGWRVVLGCLLMALFLFGFGLYGQGVYLAELQRLNDWPAALISGAITLSFLFSNIFATFTNELVARLGVTRLVFLGIAALAASTTLIALATSLWQLYAAFMLMSLAWRSGPPDHPGMTTEMPIASFCSQEGAAFSRPVRCFIVPARQWRKP